MIVGNFFLDFVVLHALCTSISLIFIFFRVPAIGIAVRAGRWPCAVACRRPVIGRGNSPYRQAIGPERFARCVKGVRGMPKRTIRKISINRSAGCVTPSTRKGAVLNHLSRLRVGASGGGNIIIWGENKRPKGGLDIFFDATFGKKTTYKVLRTVCCGLRELRS